MEANVLKIEPIIESTKVLNHWFIGRITGSLVELDKNGKFSWINLSLWQNHIGIKPIELNDSVSKKISNI